MKKDTANTTEAKTRLEWPVLTHYDQDHLRKIAMPIGGIGTGTISLGGRGDLRDWEIVNRPAKGFAPQHAFFVLYAKQEGRSPVTRALEGVIDPIDYEGPGGCPIRNHGWPRFRNCSFSAAYPFGQVHLSDPEMPVDVRMKAFNPLVPGDSDKSGIPAAIIRFELINKTDEPVSVSVCGCVSNFIGTDGRQGRPMQNINVFNQEASPVDLSGMYMYSAGVDPQSEQYGTMALATTADDVTYSPAWKGWDIKHSWGEKQLNMWRDFSSDGRLEPHSNDGADDPVASLAASVEIPAHGSKEVTFILAWHFPNRQSWDVLIKPKIPRPDTECCGGGVCRDEATVRIGNYYTAQYKDAWEAAIRTAEQLPELERETMLFVESFLESDLPDVVKEAALNNLSTLRSQTCFRTEDGRFYGWEGCWDHEGSCQGSCTHVWNYELVTPFLFGELACLQREVEFAYAVNEVGLLNHRINLPLLERAQSFGVAAADGQMGTIMRLYREWQMSGDSELLRKLWPNARKALEFAWVAGGWDANQDGVMEGCQHVTYDIEFFGPNPLTGIWYLGALRGVEEMARYSGEDEFAAKCRRLFEQGSQWVDAHLFNGEYYVQDIYPFKQADIAIGLQTGEGAVNEQAPEVQLGNGCLIDQLVGQYMSHVCGLGYLVDPEHIVKTLSSIMKYNFRADMYDHFNYMRSFTMNDEAALLICTYPHGNTLEYSFPYSTEVMTGLEYTAAIGMLFEGQTEDGLACIANIRSRYDGRKRNPFNEAECGNHYARAMASWGAVPALSGFRYSAVEQSIEFKASSLKTTVFWSNGYAWGTLKQTPAEDQIEIELAVMHGTLCLKRLALQHFGEIKWAEPELIRQGQFFRHSMKLT